MTFMLSSVIENSMLLALTGFGATENLSYVHIGMYSYICMYTIVLETEH